MPAEQEKVEVQHPACARVEAKPAHGDNVESKDAGENVGVGHSTGTKAVESEPIVEANMESQSSAQAQAEGEVKNAEAQESVEESETIDTRAFFSFNFFLLNLGVCVFWYAFRYDPSGTVNPPWTDVFG